MNNNIKHIHRPAVKNFFLRDSPFSDWYTEICRSMYAVQRWWRGINSFKREQNASRRIYIISYALFVFYGRILMWQELADVSPGRPVWLPSPPPWIYAHDHYYYTIRVYYLRISKHIKTEGKLKNKNITNNIYIYNHTMSTHDVLSRTYIILCNNNNRI